MSERTRHITEGVRKFSPLLQAFEAGYSIEQIKASVYQTLEPEFRNSAVLGRYGIDLLTVEATNVAKLKLQPDAHALYRATIDTYYSSLDKDPDRCARVCADWEQEIGKSLHLYWNSVRLEVDKTDLPLDEFAYEALRNIGSLIESTMQPYLRGLLHLCLANSRADTTKEAVAALDFGEVVNRLEVIRFGGKLLRPKQFNIALNQWRNIAQHFSFTTDDTSITCTYGRGHKRFISFLRSELWEVLVSLTEMQRAIRSAHTVFTLDESDALAAHCKGYARKDNDLQFQFVVGAASQGFEVAALSVSADCASATFQDVTEGDPTSRGIHASQFVLELWKASKSARLKITYRTKAGVPHLCAEALGKDCEKFAIGNKDIQYLAEVVALTLTKVNEA
jgi:hypothetical protein